MMSFANTVSGPLKPANAKVRSRVVHKGKTKKEKTDNDEIEMNGHVLKIEADQPVKKKASRRKPVDPPAIAKDIQKSAEKPRTVVKKKRKISEEVKEATKPTPKAKKKLSEKCSNVEKVFPERRSSLRNRK